MKLLGGLLCAAALLSLLLDALGFAAVPTAWRVRWSHADLVAAHVVLVALGLTLWLVGLRHARRTRRHPASGEAAMPVPPPAAPAARKAAAEREADIVEAGRK